MKASLALTERSCVAPVPAPPSKSMSHRLLVCAGLSAGESVIANVAYSEDILATMDCLRALGATVTAEGDTVRVVGADPRCALSAELCCRESGSTLRFFVPLCLLSGAETRLRCAEGLARRPMDVYETLCAEQGLLCRASSGVRTVRGPLQPGRFAISGAVSSQFVSGLLFALPLLDGDSVIELTPPVVSRSYIELTRKAQEAFGVVSEWEGETTLRVPGAQRYRARNARVEGDWSNAAFFLALGAEVSGLDPDSAQGDRIVVHYMKALEESFASCDLQDCPDLGPVLFVWAALHKGGRFLNVERLRIKESDRVACMAEELAKFGVRTGEASDGSFTVFPGPIAQPREPVCGHNDHRIVMAMSILAAKTRGAITGAEAVRKSCPDFFGRLRALGISVEIEDEDGEAKNDEL